MAQTISTLSFSTKPTLECLRSFLVTAGCTLSLWVKVCCCLTAQVNSYRFASLITIYLYANHLHVQSTRNKALRPLRSKGNRGTDVWVSQGPGDFFFFQVHNFYCPWVICCSQETVSLVHWEAVDLLLIHMEAFNGLFERSDIQQTDSFPMGSVQPGGTAGREHHGGHVICLRELELSCRSASPIPERELASLCAWSHQTFRVYVQAQYRRWMSTNPFDCHVSGTPLKQQTYKKKWIQMVLASLQEKVYQSNKIIPWAIM